MSKHIEVRDLNVYYNKFHAVSDVNLVVEPYSVAAFIGPSGCGKSAVLCTLNRVHEAIPSARCTGEVPLDGIDLYGLGIDPVTVRRVVEMIFQRPNPFPSMSIHRNVTSGLRLSGEKSRTVLDGAVEKAPRGTDLRKKVKDRLGEVGVGLSNGQQQRLYITQAVAVQPDALLMDKPCLALDPTSALAIEDLIHKLKERYTVVIVTHNMQQAARASDKTAFFSLKAQDEPGHLVEIGSTERIFHNPEKKAMEDYIIGCFG